MRKLLITSLLVALVTLVNAGTNAQQLGNLFYYLTPNAHSPGCVGFSAYVYPYNGNTGSAPPISVQKTLLQTLVAQTNYRCIMAYNFNAEVAAVAQGLGIKVLGVVWLDLSRSDNTVAINNAIHATKSYPNTVIGLTCGSEMAFRYGNNARTLNEVENCVNALRGAGLTTPIGTNDALPVWNARYTASNLVDWIGVNIYPWYDNPATCTPMLKSINETYLRFLHTKSLYLGKPAVVTEHGWPGSPSYIQVGCAVADDSAQHQYLQGVTNTFRQHALAAIAFSAFREPYKAYGQSNLVEAMWGQCNGYSPYACQTTRVV
jgi:exo-beta-1,3-glucanase (GH17 family)